MEQPVVALDQTLNKRLQQSLQMHIPDACFVLRLLLLS